MPRAKLTLTIPDHTWIGRITRANDDARFRILAAIADDRTGVVLTEIAAPDLPGVLSDLETEPEVAAVDLLGSDDEEALVQFETTAPMLLLPLQNSGVPLETPFEIVDGTAEWTLTAPRERLSTLGEQLSVLGIDFAVDYVRRDVDSEQLLTDRQLRLVVAAVERGYYDTPRECTLTELADAVGIAKSTCSETLHRAEGAIVKQFVEELPESTRPEV